MCFNAGPVYVGWALNTFLNIEDLM